MRIGVDESPRGARHHERNDQGPSGEGHHDEHPKRGAGRHDEPVDEVRHDPRAGNEADEAHRESQVFDAPVGSVAREAVDDVGADARDRRAVHPQRWHEDEVEHERCARGDKTVGRNGLRLIVEQGRKAEKDVEREEEERQAQDRQNVGDFVVVRLRQSAHERRAEERDE